MLTDRSFSLEPRRARSSRNSQYLLHKPSLSVSSALRGSINPQPATSAHFIGSVVGSIRNTLAPLRRCLLTPAS